MSHEKAVRGLRISFEDVTVVELTYKAITGPDAVGGAVGGPSIRPADGPVMCY